VRGSGHDRGIAATAMAVTDNVTLPPREAGGGALV
jgi:hypothetical protein